MSTIEPITFPLNKGIATKLNVLVLNFETSATTATTYYQLLSDEDVNLSDGNYTLTEEEFAAWGQDNKYVDTCVANAIGVTIIETL